MSENLVKVLAAQVEEMRRVLYALVDNNVIDHDRINLLQDRVLELEKKVNK